MLLLKTDVSTLSILSEEFPLNETLEKVELGRSYEIGLDILRLRSKVLYPITAERQQILLPYFNTPLGSYLFTFKQKNFILKFKLYYLY